MLGEALIVLLQGTNITGEKVVNHPQTQLNDALIESYPALRFCQFPLSSEPLWAWVCSVLDPQDSINELLNCVLQPLEEEKGRSKVDRR